MTGVDLIPDELRFAQMRRRRVRNWGVALAVLAAVATLPVVVDWTRAASAAELRIERDRLQSELERTRTQLRAATTEASRAHLELERSRALREKRAWSGLFALIASCLPEDCWLSAVATDPQTPPGGAARRPPQPTPATPGAQPEVLTIEAPRKLRITGFSEDDTQPLTLVTRLKESEVFRSVTLERALRAGRATDNAAPGAVYEFEVVCEW